MKLGKEKKGPQIERNTCEGVLGRTTLKNVDENL